MKALRLTIALVFLTVPAIARNWRNVRVDHQTRDCSYPLVAVGSSPSPSSVQPFVYLIFEGDDRNGGYTAWFQKSTDGGKSWLSSDVQIGPDSGRIRTGGIIADRNGRVFVAYDWRASDTTHDEIYCIRSTDRGETWSFPMLVCGGPHPQTSDDMERLAIDTAGHLFVAWMGDRSGQGLGPHVWSSVSTDDGATWRAPVLVDDDTVPGSAPSDVFVQPGTNNYLVAANCPFWVEPEHYESSHSMFMRSDDGGLTFSPSCAFDTGLPYDAQIVAGLGWIVADWLADDTNINGNCLVYSRSSSDGGATWGAVAKVSPQNRSTYLRAPLATDGLGTEHSVFGLDDGDYSWWVTSVESDNAKQVEGPVPEVYPELWTADGGVHGVVQGGDAVNLWHYPLSETTLKRTGDETSYLVRDESVERD